ncbi:MAG: electron transfer flavoprotein subunit beta/FixA family protein [Elusimicrobia bacterium]|nr:electron transfer flavoprotein subunit beta/FixA family protein [Elusimicrobiota bacterium]
MHSIVCVKPVPDPSRFDKLRLDPDTMLLRRDEAPAVINPMDRNALEAAFELKRLFGGAVSALTMAAPSAEEQLQETLALGCDRAVLLSDKAFAGADTLATARCLHAAVRRLGRFDLILCGGCSADGSTGQVGPQLAELLGIPDLTFVCRLELKRKVVRAHCRLENGQAVCETALPALVTLDSAANAPRLTPMHGIQKALRKKITVWSARDLRLAPKTVGLAGSPTRMLNIFTPSSSRKGEILQGSANEVSAQLIEKLRREQILAGGAR